MSSMIVDIFKNTITTFAIIIASRNEPNEDLMSTILIIEDDQDIQVI